MPYYVTFHSGDKPCYETGAINIMRDNNLLILGSDVNAAPYIWKLPACHTLYLDGSNFLIDYNNELTPDDSTLVNNYGYTRYTHSIWLYSASFGNFDGSMENIKYFQFCKPIDRVLTTEAYGDFNVTNVEVTPQDYYLNPDNELCITLQLLFTLECPDNPQYKIWPTNSDYELLFDVCQIVAITDFPVTD